MNDLTKAILILVLIVALLFIPSKIYGAFKSLQALGNPEANELTQLEDSCNNKIDASQDIGRCALDIAEKSINASGRSPLIAERWLRTQIENTDDEAILKESYDFAKNKLYSGLITDRKSVLDTYTLLYKKLPLPELKTQIDNLNTQINPSGQTSSTPFTG